MKKFSEWVELKEAWWGRGEWTPDVSERWIEAATTANQLLQGGPRNLRQAIKVFQQADKEMGQAIQGLSFGEEVAIDRYNDYVYRAGRKALLEKGPRVLEAPPEHAQQMFREIVYEWKRFYQELMRDKDKWMDLGMGPRGGEGSTPVFARKHQADPRWRGSKDYEGL